MGRIRDRFDILKDQDSKALVAYIMGGDPSVPATEELACFLDELGVDLLEIGVPFSDPLADGPTIQEAGQRALGTSLGQLLEMVARLRSRVSMPMLLMTYFNPVFRLGVEDFAEEAGRAGVDGIIVPDLIPEEGGDLLEACKRQDLDYIPLLAPTSTDQRIEGIAPLATGFIYYVSRTGTTGARTDISADLEENLERIRKRSEAPIAVGFGISNPDQAEQVTRHADGAVIGSAIVKLIAEADGDLHRMKDSLRQFLSPIIARLHSSS
jgi:tryptophan synthase alpha chain